MDKKVKPIVKEKIEVPVEKKESSADAEREEAKKLMKEMRDLRDILAKHKEPKEEIKAHEEEKEIV